MYAHDAKELRVHGATKDVVNDAEDNISDDGTIIISSVDSQYDDGSQLSTDEGVNLPIDYEMRSTKKVII